ncbi:hypothetical protein [Rheinheimera sp. EpRS3]|uniref:hypothetical protein n=1 Tax=Rheinheimera sp. EpRS3 TaxID=1712383 RepID=UPI000748C9D7|nr:hypothetical protein [Rheinheimera sp. EpRS3]KUM52199.1 hypothetical protein AR688_02520 [Rheinheimera sp. EpRS3]
MLFQVTPPKGVNLANFNFDAVPAEYFTDFVISKKDLEIFRHQAKKLKRENKIPHHAALDLIASNMKFHHWKHLLTWREKSQEIEQAFYKGCVVAFDSLEHVDLEDGSLIEIGRSTLMHLFGHELKELYGSQVDEDDKCGRLVSETHSDSDLMQYVQESVEGMDFYRIAPTVYYRSLKQAVKIVQDRCFWLPIIMRYRGRIIDTRSLPTKNNDGNIVGLRY